MARNYLVFLVGLVLLIAFSFVFCYNAIYAQNVLSAVFSIIGFIVALISSMAIGFSAREEGGTLWVYFFVLAGATAVVFIWFLTKGGTLLQIW